MARAVTWKSRAAAAGVLAAGLAQGQTRVNLRWQASGIDFSGAASTKPFKTGILEPAVCQKDEVFLKSDASGQTLLLCSAPNVWTAVGTNGGSSIPNPFTFPGPASFAASGVGAPSFTIPDGIAPRAPAGGNFWVSGGKLWWHNGTKPVAFVNDNGAGGELSGHTTVGFSVTPVFPVGSWVSQGFTMTLTGNVSSSSFDGPTAAGQEVWFRICQDTIGGRSFVYPANVIGSGAVDPAPNACTTQTFRSDGMNLVAIANASSDAMSPGFVTGGGAIDLPAGPDRLAGLAASNSFTGVNDFSAASSTAPVKTGRLGAIPGACSTGQMYFADDAPAGQNLYFCTSANTWTRPQSAGGGVPAGTTIGVTEWIEYLAAVCQQYTPSLAFSMPTSNAPMAVCKTGVNTQLGVAQFTAAGQNVHGSFLLPDDWTAVQAVEFHFVSETASGEGLVGWNFAYGCSATSSGDLDPALAAAQSATVAAAASNATNVATLAAPAVIGCAAGQRMFFRIALDPATTAAGNHDLLSIRFKLKRTVTAL